MWNYWTNFLVPLVNDLERMEKQKKEHVCDHICSYMKHCEAFPLGWQEKAEKKARKKASKKKSQKKKK